MLDFFSYLLFSARFVSTQYTICNFLVFWLYSLSMAPIHSLKNQNWHFVVFPVSFPSFGNPFCHAYYRYCAPCCALLWYVSHANLSRRNSTTRMKAYVIYVGMKKLRFFGGFMPNQHDFYISNVMKGEAHFIEIIQKSSTSWSLGDQSSFSF